MDAIKRQERLVRSGLSGSLVPTVQIYTLWHAVRPGRMTVCSRFMADEAEPLSEWEEVRPHCPQCETGVTEVSNP